MALLPDLESAEQAYERGQIELLDMLEGSSGAMYRTCIVLLQRDDMKENVRLRVLDIYKRLTSSPEPAQTRCEQESSPSCDPK